MKNIRQRNWGIGFTIFVCLRGAQIALAQQISDAYPEFSTDLANTARDYLVNICEPNGRKNIRTVCTEGYEDAVKFVSGEMKDMDLVPLGDNGTFIQTIPDSVDPTWCPWGMSNVVGMVRGTKFPDKYIVYVSILNGNFNLNPETYATLNNDNFSFVIDNAVAAAHGLAIAREIKKYPPLYSTIFLFTAAGNGWNIVGERVRGDQFGTYQQFNDTKWFENVCSHLVTSDALKCADILMIGLTYWINKQTIPMEDIELMFFGDRLGSPYGFKENMLVLLGGEQFVYKKEGSTLNNFLDEVWPQESTLQLVKAPLAATDGEKWGWILRQQYLLNPCISRKLCTGLKVAWFTQLACQLTSERIDFVRTIYREQLSQGNNSFPSPVYYTTDNLSNFYWDHFEPTVKTMFDIFNKTANMNESIGVSFNETKEYHLESEDVEHLLTNIDILRKPVQDLPEGVKFTFAGQLSFLRDEAVGFLENATNGNLSFASQKDQDRIRQTFTNVAGLFVAVDYFNPNYPFHKEFKDQTFGTQSIDTPTSAPTNTFSKSGLPKWTIALIVVASTVVFNVVVVVPCVLRVMKSREAVVDTGVAAYPVAGGAELPSHDVPESTSDEPVLLATVVHVDREAPQSLGLDASRMSAPLPCSEEDQESFRDASLYNMENGIHQEYTTMSSSAPSTISVISKSSALQSPEFKYQVQDKDNASLVSSPSVTSSVVPVPCSEEEEEEEDMNNLSLITTNDGRETTDNENTQPAGTIFIAEEDVTNEHCEQQGHQMEENDDTDQIEKDAAEVEQQQVPNLTNQDTLGSEDAAKNVTSNA